MEFVENQRFTVKKLNENEILSLNPLTVRRVNRVQRPYPGGYCPR